MSKLSTCCFVTAILAVSICRFAGAQSSAPQRLFPTTLPTTQPLVTLSEIGKGNYLPPRIKKYGEAHEPKFDTSFEELAPGRDSGSNEWSAFGAEGNDAFNCMGRDMRVRYPAYDLVFRIGNSKGDDVGDLNKEISPGTLDSFRLGLVHGNLPAIWGGWEYQGLLYKVSVMSVPFDEHGAFDLYKLEIQNLTDKDAPSHLTAGLDGPPDMKADGGGNGGVIRGLGGAPFLIADAPQQSSIVNRDWGCCDKRAKSYLCGDGPGKTEPAISTTRIGMDGLPVVYRVKVEPGKKYTVCVAASPNISGLLGQPTKSGDLVYRYQVEGAAAQDIDQIDYIAKKAQPICAKFDGVTDTDGDGYIQITAGNAPQSHLKHTRLSAIYVFPDGTKIDDLSSVYSGAMNDKCVAHVDVGVTPECSWNNQQYDQTDVGFTRLNLNYGGTLHAGETKTYWLKVPPIYRRKPVSMASVEHAFSQVMPGEAVPPFDAAQVQRLADWSADQAWQSVIDSWDKFFAKAAKISSPDPILQDIFLSRLATRAILDVSINDKVWYNACSPWFYFDFAYRDHAYVIYANDLAGLHDRAARLLNSYCMETKDVPTGFISFAEKPLQLGQSPDGLWLTRPGQFDAQGQNLWCLVEHYKLSGDRAWLEQTSYPFIRKGAMWLVNSRHKEMDRVKDPNDPRYGLIEPNAMEVASMTHGQHQYYIDAWAILGLREAADAAAALGKTDDAKMFAQESADLRAAMRKSMEATFKRLSLYQGYIWFGVEPEGEGMYGFWGHTPLVWPTRSVEPHDPMLDATFNYMQRMAVDSGGDMYSEGQGGDWPYIGVDWAISNILRGEPDRARDYFCAYTDTAGETLSWGEGYDATANFSGGDQPHMWADAQWIDLYRHLFAMEDGNTLLLTPATLRRWQDNPTGIEIDSLPTQFGNLKLSIHGNAQPGTIDYAFRLSPQGDQAQHPLDKIVINARTPGGRKITSVQIDGESIDTFFGEQIILPHPQRNHYYQFKISLMPEN